jgi:16S rRNA (guanine527-N7)-methyltransferase
MAAMKTLEKGARQLGIDLDERQLRMFEVYYREVVAWNSRVNLTSVTGYKEVQVKHFLDSLTVATVIQKAPALKVIDIGTGAGLPGIPLKIVFPDMELTLLEATGKKAEFLQHITGILDLNNIEIVKGRAEEIAHYDIYRERFDVVLARALATLPSLVELALPFCRIGGCLIAQKKGDIDEELAQAAKAIELMGGKLREVRRIGIEELSDNRKLVIIDKVKETPPEYPRRSGMPVKRPIK